MITAKEAIEISKTAQNKILKDEQIDLSLKIENRAKNGYCTAQYYFNTNIHERDINKIINLLKINGFIVEVLDEKHFIEVRWQHFK